MITIEYPLPPLPSNGHHRSNSDCLEGKREICQVCSVLCCVQHLCTVQCAHIRTDLTVVCLLDLAFLWLYCVLQLICVRFSFWDYFVLLQFICICVLVLDLASLVLRYAMRFARNNVSEMTYFCRVGRKTLT